MKIHNKLARDSINVDRKLIKSKTMIIQPAEMDAASKVWIFQSDQAIDKSMEVLMREELTAFLTEWAAHNVKLYASGDIVHARFITIMVDERYTGASGCSLDKMHQFIHYLEQKYHLNLMDRMQVAYCDAGDDDIKTVSINELSKMVQNQVINDETYVFDNLVPTKGDYDARWKVKIKDSWHKRFIR